jgi:3-hydroxyacyl-CoA dehydrogenase
MTDSEISHVGIVGSGRMGTDIFYYLADHYFNLTWVCISEDERKKSADSYMRKLARKSCSGLYDDSFVSYRKMHTNITSHVSDLSDSDIIIEAIWENEGAKAGLFESLQPVVGSNSIVVSNSSSFKPSRFIRHVQRPEFFAGLHFFYPVKYKNIAEIIFTDRTGDFALRRIKMLLAALGKFYIVMHEKDGFILNKIFLALQARAYRYFAEGTLGMKEIDSIAKRDIFPVGIFEFFDSVGLDVMYQSVINYTLDLSDREFYGPLLEGLHCLIEKNRIRGISGAGFYDHYKFSDNDYQGNDLHDSVSLDLRCLYINSAFKALERKICSKEDMDYAIKEYMGVEKGPFEIADEIGTGKVLDILTSCYNKTGFDVYHPSSLLQPT